MSLSTHTGDDDENAHAQGGKHIHFAVNTTTDNDPHDINERTALFHTRSPRYKQQKPPLDTNNMAYYIFFLLGIGSLLPWNAFITASAYYRHRFCGTAYYWNFEAFFSVAYSLSSELSLVVVVLCRVTTVFFPLIIFCTIFITTTILVLFPSMDGNDFFLVTMISITIVGIVASMVRSGVFTLAGYFPPRYTQAVMGGIGMGGVIISLLCIITTATSSTSTTSSLSYYDCPTTTENENVTGENNELTQSPTVNWSAFMYFALASMVLASNIVGYLVLKRLPITKYYERHSEGTFVRPILLADSYTLSQGDVMSLRNIELWKDDEDKLNDDVDDEEEETALAAAWRVLKIVKRPGFSIFFVFVITYSLYPGLTTLITSTAEGGGGGATAALFAPAMFLLFNLGDLSGRLVCGFVDIQGDAIDAESLSKHVTNASIIRLIFLPAFLLCNVAGTVLPVVFDHDAWPFVFMALFSFTSGVLATMSMMIAPTMVDFQDKRSVGAIMTFLLSTGLLAGSCASFLSVRIATGSY